MASGSGAPARSADAPEIPGAFSPTNLTFNGGLRGLSRLLEHSTISKTTGSDPQNDPKTIHIFSTLIYCLLHVCAVSQSILVSTSIYVFGHFYNKSNLNNQPSQALDSIGHGSLESEPREAADISPPEPQGLNDPQDVPMPDDIAPEEIVIGESDELATSSPRETESEPDGEHAEAGRVEVIVISDSEDDDGRDSCSLKGADGNINDQESESQEDKLIQGKENSKQPGTPAANGYDAATASGIRTPISSITSGDEFVLTGKTLIGSGSVTNILLPDLSDEFPALEHNEKGCHHKPPENVPASAIPKSCKFYNDLGWVSTRPKKRCNGALTAKIERRLSVWENSYGLLYIRQHTHYNNLYKIGVTTTALEDREKDHPPCIMEKSSRVYNTKNFMGCRRAETLVKLHMTSRNVPLKLCLRCYTGKQDKKPKAHIEWFAGNYKDIQECVDFWAKTVHTLYDEAAFTGYVDDMLRTVLSSEGRRRQLRQASIKSKEHLNSPGATPCPQCTEAKRRPSTSSTGAEEDGETDSSNEMVGNVRRRLWERRDRNAADVGATPKEKAARGSGGGQLSVRRERPQTRSGTKRLGELGTNTVPLSAQDI